MPSRIEVTERATVADGRSPAGGLRILLAQKEDDERAALWGQIERWGHGARTAGSGGAAASILATHEIDLALVASDLPEWSALQACRSLRASGRPLLFLLLRSWTSDADWMANQDVRFDDYLLRPVCPAELRLRIHVRLGTSRRADVDVAADGRTVLPAGPRGRLGGRFAHGPLQVDFDRYQVYVDGREVLLTVREMEVLRYFSRSPGYLRSRQDLLTGVWGYQPGVTSRTVDICIKRLRRKLGPAAQLIETVRGAGYRFGGRETASMGDPHSSG